MKTLTQVLQENPQHKKLIRAVIRRIGLDSVQDVNNHGIDGGFNGFIYTKDTSAFFGAFRKEILNLAEESAESLGIGVLEMIQGFRCVGEDFALSEIGKVLYDRLMVDQEPAPLIRNAMSWFAAESVCHFFED